MIKPAAIDDTFVSDLRDLLGAQLPVRVGEVADAGGLGGVAGPLPGGEPLAALGLAVPELLDLRDELGEPGAGDHLTALIGPGPA